MSTVSPVPEISVGTPFSYQAISVFPLFIADTSTAEYRLASDALEDRSLVVRELNDHGSVPRLIVENHDPVRVLLLEGEHLLGAKQDRIVNTSILVPANAELQIPVSCVEQGRWSHRTEAFRSSDTHPSSKVRGTLKSSVTAAMFRDMEPRSDQAAIWQSVMELHRLHSVSTTTGAMMAAFTSKAHEIEEYRNRLPYVENANGLCVAVNDNVVGIDLFDQPATCRRVWNRLLSGYILDAIVTPASGIQPAPHQVDEQLGSLKSANWRSVKTVGDGQESRVIVNRLHASVLSLGENVIHLSAVRT